ncbi:FAD-binding protein [Lactiplantibacillus plajomi]|uniref:Urocanate reductase n=1 Tax=Lactiplantibacillus plajomi TaxID=1457217 RepID=A0ABV6JZT2_9LACO|nr:FAD-binding protein [Lactiplantibacillus plajomi]
MLTNKIKKWDAQYDVVIVGFGGAGASAARFAADHDAKVLLIDSAPEGHEGGNTRYSGGDFSWSDNFDDLKDYYIQTYYPFKYDEKVLNTFVENVCNMKEYARKHFGIESWYSGHRPNGEYPEYRHSDSMKSQFITHGEYNSAFWKFLRKQVYQRLDKITIWYDSPAEHLIQDPDTGTVVGVQMKRQDQDINVHAKNGVILSLGGYENNQDMVQNFLGQGSLAPIGSLYNKGQGIKLVMEIGGQLWHTNYDSHGFSLNHGDAREKFAYMIQWKSLFNGSIFVAGDDGTRYYRENEQDRHGFKYNHGNWVQPVNQNHPHIIFDQKQYDYLINDTSEKSGQIKQLLSYAIKANSIQELATTINTPKLEQAVSDFNFMVGAGRDIYLNREIKTMRIFGDGPFYAIPIRHNILHTHGGGRRNSECEVLDVNNRPIPHLYEAGEFGDIFATKYIGCNSLADLLISGKIAGINAAKPKSHQLKVDAVTSASQTPDYLKTDAHQSPINFPVDHNQGIGISANGLSEIPIVVRTTVDDNKQLNKIEILQEKETPSVGEQAINKLSQQMMNQKDANVDAVSGATISSNAFKDAVNKALKNVNGEA